MRTNFNWAFFILFQQNIYSSLRKKCPYSDLFWSTFSHIRTKYGEIRNIFPYSVRMRENADQINFEQEHFLRSASCCTDHQNQQVQCKKIELFQKHFPKVFYPKVIKKRRHTTMQNLKVRSLAHAKQVFMRIKTNIAPNSFVRSQTKIFRAEVPTDLILWRPIFHMKDSKS